MTNSHRSCWRDGWRIDAHSITRFTELQPGQAVSVAKWTPDGKELTRYPATVVKSDVSPPWIEVEAIWTMRQTDVAGLQFIPGDRLREFFSPEHPFNAFAVYTPNGVCRGWYGNVTCPTHIVDDPERPLLVWRDLFLDAVILADGEIRLLDDDELEASGIPRRDPDFAQAIVAARDDLLRAIELFPVLDRPG